jgi:hypothetical protein
MFQVDSRRMAYRVILAHHFDGTAIPCPLLLITTMRYVGFFFAPNRASRIISILSYCTIGSLNLPSRLPIKLPPIKLFIIFRVSAYCFSSVFTS